MYIVISKKVTSLFKTDLAQALAEVGAAEPGSDFYRRYTVMSKRKLKKKLGRFIKSGEVKLEQ